MFSFSSIQRFKISLSDDESAWKKINQTAETAVVYVFDIRKIIKCCIVAGAVVRGTNLRNRWKQWLFKKLIVRWKPKINAQMKFGIFFKHIWMNQEVCYLLFRIFSLRVVLTSCHFIVLVNTYQYILF